MINYDTYSHLFGGSWSIYNEEKPTWDVVETFLNPGCVFLDIGCQKGIYSKGVIDVLGKDCLVYGFDVLQHPEIIQLEKENSNFKFINSAVGDGKTPENCVVHYDTNTIVDDQNTISIDQFCEEYKINNVDFIKIDVDGCEKSVLRGCENLFQKSSPRLVIEIETDFDICVDMLKGYGYEYLFSRNGVNMFFEKK